MTDESEWITLRPGFTDAFYKVGGHSTDGAGLTESSLFLGAACALP